LSNPLRLARAPGTDGPAEDDATAIAASLREPERFAVVFDRHAPHIHRYLARQLGAQAADDLVAETFLTAFGKRSRFDQRRQDARPWLYGIAANLAARHRHDGLRRQRLLAAAGTGDDAAGSHADRVVAGVAAAGFRRTLAAALADLPAGDRDVLLLIAWEQLTYEEVAQALGIPVGTVRSRLNRARRRVRVALADLDPTMAHKELLTND
jgi:RNA polymerase sigma factor (sigma-70 family)